MKIFRFLVSVGLLCSLVYFLNSKIGDIPPLGKLLSPFSGFWVNGNQTGDKKFSLNEIKDKAHVYYDERMVPHIFASNEEDVYFLQGFVTAMDRLWQMEIQTHNAAGRVSEIVGAKTLETDRFQRRIGLGFGAERALEEVMKNPVSKMIIESYTKGINAYIDQLNPEDFPIEYKILDYKPERWTPLKTCLLLKNMANMLCVYEYDIENSNFIEAFGENAFNQLYPRTWPEHEPIIPEGTIWNFTNEEGADDHGNVKPLPNHTDTNTIITSDQAPEKPDEINGSNNWAVHGSKTRTGKPILCNDPHLKLSLPSIWYEIHLVTPKMNVYGVSLPGAPCIIIGFNDSIAWGVTNAGRDVRDWTKIEFTDNSKKFYKNGNNNLRTQIREEKIEVRNDKTYIDRVKYTHLGPIVYDENYKNPESNQGLCMQWTAHKGSNELLTFYYLNNASNHNQYLEALNHYTTPAQNFVFASASGDIAIKEQGLFPIQNPSLTGGGFITNSATSDFAWKQFIPFKNNPHIINPERGFVSSANQHPTDTTYPYYYSPQGPYEQDRNVRINKVLSTGQPIDVALMMKLQNDNYNQLASKSLPVLLQFINRDDLNNREIKILEKLKKWNYFDNPESNEATYFEIWWYEIKRLLWDEIYTAVKPMKLPNNDATLRFIEKNDTSFFYDIKGTRKLEIRKDILSKALINTVDSLENIQYELKIKNWGNFKNTEIQHIARIAPFSKNAFIGGNLGIVNATNSTHGPSWRMIVDFGENKAWGIIPGGSSGNPASEFYDNGIEKWANGEYYELQRVSRPASLKKILRTFEF